MGFRQVGTGSATHGVRVWAGACAKTERHDMTTNVESGQTTREAAPGIVIRLAASQPIRPKVSAFIWGGKTRPVPALPYGRKTAA